MRHFTAIAGAITFACAATTPASSATSPDAQSVTIDVAAKIAERCGLSAGSNSTSASGRLDRAETLTFHFGIDCNTPFRIGVSSKNGALRLTGVETADATDAQGFAVQKDYSVGLLVETDAGPLDGGSCRSDQLTAGQGDCEFYGARAGRGLSSGDAIAIDRTGTLTVSWKEEGGPGPRHAAGLFQDTLIVVAGPRT